MSPTPSDSYFGFARHYDVHGWDWYGRVYGPRLVELLRARGLAGCRVLDAGCGTGSMALILARAGFRVTGVDLAEPMLDVARAKDDGGLVRWTRADLTSLDLGETFDAVLTVGDVLNHLETLDAWEGAFRALHAHLVPGGLLFFDVMTCRGLAGLDLQAIQEKDDRILLATAIWEPAARRSTLKVTSFLPVPGTGLWSRATETIPEWGHPAGAVLERLSRAGFRDPERPFAEGDDPELEERLAVAARRP